MNNKGLTLVELLAVIAIIAVITIMITPGILSVRESVLESTYENKVSQIVNAGIDYGTEHITELKSPVTADYVKGQSERLRPDPDCIYRTVNFLIINGYLASANTHAVEEQANNNFLDPRTNTPMNDRSVCIRFDSNNAMTREIIAYLVEG